jgi:hypothetical protein
MSDKRTKVFLSSTVTDLKDYRYAVREAIRRAEIFECVCMEDFGAQPETPLDVCLAILNECDMFVGIVGWQYGSCPPGKSKSYTEYEYDAAEKNIGMTCLMYLADETFSTEARFRESDEQHRRLEHFRQRIKESHVVSQPNSPDQLAVNVINDLYNQNSKVRVIQPERDYVQSAGTASHDHHVVVVTETVSGVDISIKKKRSPELVIPALERAEPAYLRKLTLADCSSAEVIEFDFSRGYLPEGMSLLRASYAGYPIEDDNKYRLAKDGEPRFVKVTSADFALLLEPMRTNYLHNSAEPREQWVTLDRGTYVFWFQGSGTVRLSGIFSAIAMAGNPMVFTVDSNEPKGLRVSPEGVVTRFQLERGQVPTTFIESTDASTTRTADCLRIEKLAK